MKRKLITAATVLALSSALLLLLMGVAAADPDPAAPTLLLTEIVVTPTDGEFVEIHNPTGNVITLTDVYLTDATWSGGSFYYNIVSDTNAAGGGSFTDFHARFPDGATIGPGEYQTIAMAGSDAFSATYGITPTYELFEDGSAPDAIPDMREAFSGSINNQGGLTNDGEVVILYYWNGLSDLVTDLDYAVWGDKAEAVDKTGVSVDGPDADAITSTYLADTPIANQDILAGGAHNFGNSWQRDDLAEGAETAAGGNGAGGNDETSEDLTNTWCEGNPTAGAASDCPAIEIGMCGDVYSNTYTIQGNGFSSPFDGQGVVLEGIVTGDFQGSSQLSGFFVQDAGGDGDSATSDGLFVAASESVLDVVVGDSVRVSGFVAESFGMTTIGTVLDVLDCGGGAIVPTPVTLPFSDTADTERYEGMLLTFPQDLTVSENYNLGRFGQVDLSSGGRLMNPTNQTTPGAAANAMQAANNLNRIVLDDGSNVQNPDPVIHPSPELSATNTLRSGDSVTNLTGVMNYSFGAYRIHATGTPSYTAANPRPAAPDPVGGRVTVASFNVLNYFTTLDTGADICGPSGDMGCRGADSASEFTRQRDKIINAITTMNADVVGLMEIENNAVTATQNLVDGLNAVAGPGTYDFINTGAIGTDAIKVAFIYQPASVTPVGNPAILDSTVDPTFNDAKNRPALAQTFRENATGELFTAVVNHLKSKGSACDDVGDPDTGDGQGNCNLTRTAAAAALANWLASDPTASGDPDFLIIGDLNSYAMEDPITTLKARGYTNLLAQFVGPNAYTYIFAGQSGILDYALANAGLLSQVTGAAVWHINTDEPRVLDYNEEYKPTRQLTTMYDPGPYRASDHDPVMVGLDLFNITMSKSVQTGITDTLGLPPGSVVTYTITLTNPSSTRLAEQVVMTDTLPDGVTFGGFVQNPNGSVRPPSAGTITLPGGTITLPGGGSAVLPPNTLAWGPHNLAPGQRYSVVFTATVSGGYGQVVANTAHFASLNAGAGASEAGFTITSKVYLPLVVKN